MAGIRIPKPKVNLGPTVRFGMGYPLLKEDAEIKQCREWANYRDSMSHDPNMYDIMNCQFDTTNCDAVRVDKAGQIIVTDEISGERKYMMYETAFYQLLNTIQIPLSFAQRVSPGMLAELINSMISQHFTRQCFIKTYAGQAATSFTFKTSDRPLAISAYRMFEALNTKQTKQECKIDFALALRQGFKSLCAMEFADYRGKDVKGAVEVLISDSMDCRPQVVGMVITPKSHALIRSLAFPIETDDAQKAQAMMATFITRIGSEIDRHVKLYSNLEKVRVNDEMAAKIRARASKSLKQPYLVQVGHTLAQQYEALQGLRKNPKNTIMGKRDVAFFAGYLLDLARQ
jgi:hypothetical protein